jgi:hypothetical protein
MIIALIIDFNIFINFDIALLSAFFIMLGSMYSYHSLVQKRVDEYDHEEQKDDIIEKMEDPYDLYSPEIDQNQNIDDIDIRAVIKEEKQRLKSKSAFRGVAKASPALFSIYRVIPYALLIFGFIGLKNNELLLIFPYLMGIGAGVIAAYLIGKTIFSTDPAVL